MMRRLSIAAMIWSFAGLVAFASPDDDSRIARLSFMEGHVSFQHPNEVDWTAASINMALAPEDRLYTGDNGRAEIQFDDGSVIRLAEKTDVEVLSLREELVQLRILTGLCSLTVHGSITYEIDTPAAAFNTLKKGIYRFDVVDNGDTDGIVRKGRMEAENNNFTRKLDSGELIHVTTGDNSANLVSRYDQRDTWDEWTDRRDADQVAFESRRYIPDNVYVGARELDQYGRWVAVDSYGAAWVPYSVDAGWSPYWVGRWWYRPYWGWTWVSYEPWGWLPYHYGRWYHSTMYGWCWLPGPSFGFHFWSPGLVRFYEGPSWVSWCPLGPGDYYNVNLYRYNPTYNYQINNIRLVQNRAPEDLVNRNVPGAFRTVGTNNFVGSGAGGAVRNMPVERVEQPWRQGRMITDRLDVAPNVRSFSPAPDRPAVRPSNVIGLPAVVRNIPPNAGASERARLVRIDRGGATAPGTAVRGMPGDAARSGGNGSRWTRIEPTAPAGGNAGRNTGNDGNAAVESPSAGRTTPSNPARTYQTPVPGNQGRGMPGNANNQGRQAQPSPTVIENQRSREVPRNANPRPEVMPPARRMESPPPPRNDRPAPAPRAEPEKSRPAPRTPGASASSFVAPAPSSNNSGGGGRPSAQAAGSSRGGGNSRHR